MPILCGNRIHSATTYHDSIENVRTCFANPSALSTSPRKGWLQAAQANRAEIDARAEKARVTRPSRLTEGQKARRELAHEDQVAAFHSKLEKMRKIGLYEGTDSDTVKCGRCAGTGLFITGMVNGKPVGPGGECYRCLGKGRQTDCGPEQHRLRAVALVDNPDTTDWSGCCDRVRNDLYDRFGIRWNI